MTEWRHSLPDVYSSGHRHGDPCPHERASQAAERETRMSARTLTAARPTHLTGKPPTSACCERRDDVWTLSNTMDLWSPGIMRSVQLMFHNEASIVCM